MVARFLVVSFLAFLLVGGGDARSFARPTPLAASTLPKVLGVRGGACCDASTVVKVATSVSLVHGTINYLCPSPTLDTYGLKETRLTKMLMRRIGLSLLGLAYTGHALVVKDGGDLHSVLALNAAMWGVEFLTTAFNGELEAAGGESSTHWVYAAVMAAFVAGLKSDQSATAAKIYAGFVVLNGVALTLAPGEQMKMWKIPTGDATETALMRDVGIWVLGLSILFACLVWEVDALQAFTYSRALLLLRSLAASFQKPGIKKPQQTFWLVYNVVLMAALMMAGSGDGGSSETVM